MFRWNDVPGNRSKWLFHSAQTGRTSLSGDLNAPASPDPRGGVLKLEGPFFDHSAICAIERACLHSSMTVCSFRAPFEEEGEAMSNYKNGNVPGSSPGHLRSVPGTATGGRRNPPNQSQSQSPRFVLVSFQCRMAWESYRVDRLPASHPRRTPTLARLSFLDEEEGGAS